MNDARYQRQRLLPEWGAAAQEKLSRARILVVGAGGLGCPALQYLAAAGAGTLGIADGDRVSLTDLHRQILYTAQDEGVLKTECAAEYLHRMNPDVRIVTYPFSLTTANALEIIEDYDLVLDASDNFGTRYMLNDACALLGLPLVFGSVSRFEGQVAVFRPPANYRDLFPHPPASGEVANCAEAGVLGVVAGIIGNLQALEALKVVTGVGEPLVGRLLTYRALEQQFYEVEITSNDGAAAGPRDKASFWTWPYGDGCSFTYTTLDSKAFDTLRQQEDVLVLDVREPMEQPLVEEFPHEQWPLSRLRISPGAFKGRTIVVFCKSGQRSREAAALLAQENTVYQLKGGILDWLSKRPETSQRPESSIG
jgi:molybdopterin/thiamine biosynthesis adenylyltransferase/rhodanese-related sulfurtransferase